MREGEGNITLLFLYKKGETVMNKTKKHREFDDDVHKYSYYATVISSNAIVGTLLFLAQYYFITPFIPSLNTIHIFGVQLHVPIFLATTIVLMIKASEKAGLYEIVNEAKKKL